VPIDQSTEPAAATTRRTFLARTALGGALVTAGVLASPIGGSVLVAGAQGTNGTLSDGDFASFAAPLELAAVQAYLAAITSGQLEAEAEEWARLFTRNHQGVADLLATLVVEGDPVPRADEALTTQSTQAIETAADEAGVLRVLADLEGTIAATHLSAIESLADATTARTVAQVAAVESQQSALLAVAAGDTIDDVTPREATTDGALTPGSGDDAGSDETTTTTAAN
jgi:hypothetical protein